MNGTSSYGDQTASQFAFITVDTIIITKTHPNGTFGYGPMERYPGKYPFHGKEILLKGRKVGIE